jgi:hypothetical protein
MRNDGIRMAEGGRVEKALGYVKFRIGMRSLLRVQISHSSKRQRRVALVLWGYCEVVSFGYYFRRFLKALGLEWKEWRRSSDGEVHQTRDTILPKVG